MLSEGKINIKQPAGPEAHKETSAPTRPHTDATPVARSAPMRLEGKVAVIVGAGQSPVKGSGTAVRRRFASRKKAPAGRRPAYRLRRGDRRDGDAGWRVRTLHRRRD